MKKFLPIGLVAILLVAGGAAFFVLKPFGKVSQSQNQTTERQQQENENKEEITVGAVEGTIKDLIAKNVPLQCTFSHVDSEATTEGAVYLADSKIRGNFTTILNAKEPIESFVIQDSQYLYAWTSQEAKGTKIKLEDVEQEEAVEPETEAGQGAVGFNDLEKQNINYSCKPWIVDNSLFTPPNNIEFLDLNQQMEQFEEMSQEAEAVSCDLCDQLPTEEGQDQCRQSLNCQ